MQPSEELPQALPPPPEGVKAKDAPEPAAIPKKHRTERPAVRQERRKRLSRPNHAPKKIARVGACKAEERANKPELWRNLPLMEMQSSGPGGY